MNTERRKLLFVINPISGGKSKQEIPSLIDANLDLAVYDYSILWWQTSTDLDAEIAAFGKSSDAFGVVAVGGDGTINRLASVVSQTDLALGIIPQGSGNGFARALNVPLDPVKAIRHLNEATVGTLDLGMLNNRVFVNVAGCGFDAHVSHQFAHMPKRGLKSYVMAVLKSYRSARNISFTFEQEAKTIHEEAFILTIANGTQWGNDFYVAPNAQINDGALDLVFMKKPKWHQFVGLFWALTRQRTHKLITRYRITDCTIEVAPVHRCHLDGEPWEEFQRLEVRVMPNALSVLGS